MECLLNPSAFVVDMSGMREGIDKHRSRITAPNIFCRSCASPLVQATEWEQEDDSLWSVRLWCPECGFEQAASLDRPQLLYLSLAVEEGFGWMLQALAELTAAAAMPANFDFAHRAQTDRIQPAGH
jgi:hypothetical protein